MKTNPPATTSTDLFEGPQYRTCRGAVSGVWSLGVSAGGSSPKFNCENQ